MTCPTVLGRHLGNAPIDRWARRSDHDAFRTTPRQLVAIQDLRVSIEHIKIVI